MLQFKRIHRMASLIDVRNRELTSSSIRANLMETMVLGAGLARRKDCISHYAEMEGVSGYEAKKVLEAAILKGYVQRHEFGTSIDTLSITQDRGLDFLQRLGRFRIGMWNDIVKHYGVLFSALLAIVAAGVLGNIVDIIKFIAAHT